MVARVLGYQDLRVILVAPALLMSGWASIGHFVTLDEDLPGGWSNPENSQKIVFISVGELLIKIVVFLLTIYIAIG